MQFIYHEDAKSDNLIVNGDLHKYLFKIRRQNNNKNLFFRNLNDQNLYEYEIVSINKNDTFLKLLNQEEKQILPNKEIHLAWCIIDNKEIEKNIASLNEIGVSKITFIKCQYSQNKYKLNLEKLNKLLINSSMQCGRSNIIELDLCDNINKFLENNPETYMFNFSKNNINEKKEDIKTIIIGCEGGFSKKELSMFENDKIVGSNINAILKSQTAVITVSSILIN